MIAKLNYVGSGLGGTKRGSSPAGRKRGRPTVPYRTSWGECVDGLYRRPGTDRYRIAETGQEFREADEHRAVARFRQWQRLSAPDRRTLRIDVADVLPAEARAIFGPGVLHCRDGRLAPADAEAFNVALRANDARGVMASLRRLQPTADLTAEAFLRAVGCWIMADPVDAAAKLGVPGLAGYVDRPAPAAAPILGDLLDLYATKAKTDAETKRKVRDAWAAFAKHAGIDTRKATTHDLTTERLIGWRDALDAAGRKASTMAGLFGRLRVVLTFARKRGVAPDEITAALGRAAVLYVDGPAKECDPHPIARADYRRLLTAAATRRKWTDPARDVAVLLLSLNCCMHVGEVLAVKWTEVDLHAGTFKTRRTKTRGVPRAAMLWPETVAALRRLPRRGAYVFTSATGGRMQPKHYGRKVFGAIRTAAGLPSVAFDMIRDGAFTSAKHGADPLTGEKVQADHARVLAGHRTGMDDHYVLRQPGITSAAVAAVRRDYLGGWTLPDIDTTPRRRGRPRKQPAA